MNIIDKKLFVMSKIDGNNDNSKSSPSTCTYITFTSIYAMKPTRIQRLIYYEITRK